MVNPACNSASYRRSVVAHDPGSVFGGDFRYSQLIAMTTTGILIARARSGPMAWQRRRYAFSSAFVLEQAGGAFLVLLLALVVSALAAFARD
jgi:hypothetical protein